MYYCYLIVILHYVNLILKAIMKKLLLVLLALLGIGLSDAWAQRIVTGVVKHNETDLPLQGVSVIIKGTTMGDLTDDDGKFRVEVPNNQAILVFTFIGLQTQEQPVLDKNTLDVFMDPEDVTVNEVFITGYGTQIKRELTGNIAKVSGKTIENIPVPSIEQTLQGRTAGVFVESVNGKPGGAIRVRVRGSSSISASSQPLFVVDGVPITVSALNTTGAPINPMSDINFNDVESIEILKDASAAAIYGSRAANGVVIITTKQGKEGQTRINVNLQAGVSEPSGKREFLNSEEFIDLFTRAAEGAGRYEWRLDPDPSSSEQEYIDANLDFVRRRFARYDGHLPWDNPAERANTDWQEEAFQTGRIQQADINVSGGNAKTKFYVSLGSTDQEGIVIGSAFQRLSGRLNLDQQASDKLRFGVTMSLSKSKIFQAPDDNAFSTPLQLTALAPITPTRDPDGVLYDRPTTTYYNGLIELENATRRIRSYRNLTNGYAVYELLPGLKIRGEVGIDLYTLNDDAFAGRRTDGGQATNGSGNSRWSQVVNYRTTSYLNYNKSLAEKHNVDLTGGVEFQKSDTRTTAVTGQQFPVDDLKTIASAADITFGSSTFTEFSFASYFGRLNYNFDRKYLLTLSGRVDGSSRFGENNRYGFFPAASVGWVLSDEDFLNNSNLFSFLKLRASYGITGNAEIDNFRHLGLFGSSAYAGTSGLAPSQIPNPDLSWERTGQLDIGVDFGLLDDRISGEIDYYIKNTTDLLLDVPVPGITGFSTQTQNLGEIENKGLEVVLNTRNFIGDFSWSTSINFAANRNKVLDLGGQDIIQPGGNRYPNVVKVGEDIGAFYGAKYAGVDPQNGDALYFKNAEGTETTNDFNEAEFVVFGSPNPDFIGGITNTFSYKGIELNVLFQGVIGNDVHNAAGIFMSCNACWFDNQTRDQLRAWEKPGDITDVPQPRLGYSNGDAGLSSRYTSDGSYVKLRNASLSYTLPANLVKRIGLKGIRVNVTGQNLLTFTDYEGWDPEVTTDFLAGGDQIYAGLDFYAAPQPRTITGGINLSF